MNCAQCGAPAAVDDAFCENCGAPLAAPCPSCGGEIDADGWCTVCGARAPNKRDHLVESAAPAVVGVSDKGRAHARNEDAFALAADGQWAALVVCDGVSTTPGSDVAAMAAARAARDLLAATARPSGSAGDRQAYWADQVRAAAVAADKATEIATSPGAGDPASCTYAAAVTDGESIVAGWVGDSRIYWLPDEGAPVQLSTDHSWATERIAAGVPREVAEADPRGHAITRWLGADSPEVDAGVAVTVAATPGWLLVCSDGLWNYCSAAGDLHTLVAAQPQDPRACAEALVAWANEQGGHDNITVTLARIAPAAEE